MIIGAVHRILDVLVHNDTYHSRITQCLAVAVEEVRIVEVGLELADVAVVFIHSTFVRSRTGTFVASRPFAEHAGSVSVLLHYFG